MVYKQEQVCGDYYVEIIFIVFGRDISLILHIREISLHKNNSHDLHSDNSLTCYCYIMCYIFFYSFMICKPMVL